MTKFYMHHESRAHQFFVFANHTEIEKWFLISWISISLASTSLIAITILTIKKVEVTLDVESIFGSYIFLVMLSIRQDRFLVDFAKSIFGAFPETDFCLIFHEWFSVHFSQTIFGDPQLVQFSGPIFNQFLFDFLSATSSRLFETDM